MSSLNLFSKILIFSLICCVSVVFEVFAQEKKVTVTTLTNNPPFTFNQINAVSLRKETIVPNSDSRQLQGYSWDVLRESLHEMGYTIILYVYPWKRALEQVKKGKLDLLFPTGFNKERTEYFHYSKKSINRVDFLIYVKKDSPIQWNSLETLKGKIGALRGWTYGPRWAKANSFRKHELNETLQAFSMLDRGRIDGLAGYEINFDYTLKQANWKNTYRKLPVFGGTDEYAVGAKRNPKVLQILADFDEGKQRIINNGIMNSITKKWQGGN